MLVANIDELLQSNFLDSGASESGQALRRLAKLLTANSATPCFIWDNQCRAELTALLDEQVKRVVKTVSLWRASDFTSSCELQVSRVKSISVREAS